MSSPQLTIDGNEAVARVAYRLNEVIAIYPITPASPMGEWADAWAAEGRPNLWGSVPSVVELQSEAGAAGTVHGALQAGALTTTFTASQGLLLMIPNLYKLAGELTPAVLHVAARSLAAQGLSIFGDHSDVMATRGSGCGILCSASVQEAGDFAAIAARLSLRSRLPFLHVFDGFRTSHEIQKIEPLSDAQLLELMPAAEISAHRARALSPNRPVIRGTSQNPDVYFQARESVNRFYDAAPDHLIEAMARFGELTGRPYRPYDYVGPAAAERVLVLMGSGCETAVEAAEALQAAGEGVGVLKVRLFRPFAARLLVEALPASTRAIAVLDRCKEPGAPGEPLYLDVVASLAEEWAEVHGGAPLPAVLGGRYGLSSKEFTPAMVKAVFDHLRPLLVPAPPAQPLHGGHRRRPHPPLPAPRQQLPYRRRRGARRVLRPGLRWHGGGQQGGDQDHWRGHRFVCPGLFRLRLQKVGFGHGVAPALWAPADPLHLPDPEAHVCGLPPVGFRRALRSAGRHRARRRVSAQ